MSKFAEGPWKITHSELNGYRVSDQSGWGVAVVLKDANDKENAALIAAAPAMYEALQKAIEWIEDDRVDDECINEQWYHEGKAALRAAEREANR